MKLLFRILLFCSSMMHCCIHIIGFVIGGVNILLIILRTLDRMTNLERSNFRKISEYVTKMGTYRQLQVTNQVINQLNGEILPVLILLIVVASVMMGFMIVKMTGRVPGMLVFLEVTLTFAILLFIEIGFPLMSDVIRKSADFIRAVKLDEGCSSYRKRQVKSCQHLKILVGSYFCIHKGTRIELLSLIAYYTMSLVISM